MPGKYVLGIKQNTGAFAIDINTDQVVRLYPIATVQGITQTADGNVWIASVVDGCARFTCIDPQTLDERDDMSVTFLRQSHILHARGAHGVTLRLSAPTAVIPYGFR